MFATIAFFRVRHSKERENSYNKRVNCFNNVYGKKSFLSKESDTLRSYRVYISPTM